MKLKSTIAIATFSALSFGLCATAAHAFDLGGVVNAVVQPKTSKTSSPITGPGANQLTTITIKSEPYAIIYTSDTKLAPDGEVRQDPAYSTLGMTDDKGIYNDRIALRTKSIVVSKYINKAFKQKVFQYTGQTSINAKLR